MNKTAVLFVTVATWFVAANVLAAGDAAAGKTKSTACGACRGPDGNSTNPLWPKFAGEHAACLVEQPRAFKSRARKDPLMSPTAAGLSEKDMEDLAAYYASQKAR